ncbi:hypothetical protein [Deinococcus ruber]|uniref:Uncharacterized protein n=1 Tax=Deinococcus ruber TaxID=1848197 RepID=A0A918BZT3_9DEIO|nr:hypothetical protein [Deinococcus ruber]GGR00086.1 hypothetical protein GCM10008957_10980 [Deinococcus ruber]
MKAHRITVTPCHTLPGTVIIRVHGKGIPFVTDGGNHALFQSDGCKTDELETYLSDLERKYACRIARPQVAA